MRARRSGLFAPSGIGRQSARSSLQLSEVGEGNDQDLSKHVTKHECCVGQLVFSLCRGLYKRGHPLEVQRALRATGKGFKGWRRERR